MRHSKYVVASRHEGWKIFQAGHSHSDLYPTKGQAMGAAIALAERAGRSGQYAEVLVQYEDGHFSTEWVLGQDPNGANSVQPIVPPKQ
jgi:uncharacterized protein DUF2188